MNRTRAYNMALFFVILIIYTSLSGCLSGESKSLRGQAQEESFSASYGAKSIMGIVTGFMSETLEIKRGGLKYSFDMSDAESEELLPGDTVVITYNIAAPEKATGVDLIERGKNHKTESQIYDVEGTSASITGQTWKNMLERRKLFKELAGRYPLNVFVNMDTMEKSVYLTFDDGPDPRNTVSVMDTLKRYGVTGTFFFTGENMENYRDVVKRINENGFAIGLHGYSHSSLKSLSKSKVQKELDDAGNVLSDITGTKTLIMRPPYGDLDETTIDHITALNYKIFLWSIDTLDWSQTDSGEIFRNVKEHLRPGDIILMHTASGQGLSAEILPQIIEYIQKQGYDIKALS